MAKKLWSYKGPDLIEILSQNFLEIAYFIFGLTIATTGYLEKSIILLESFVEEWKKSTDLVKKRDLGPALKETDGILAHIYLNYAESHRYEKNMIRWKFMREKFWILTMIIKPIILPCYF